MNQRWLPERATYHRGLPEIGWLIASAHTVFRIARVELLDDGETLRVWVNHVGGVRPAEPRGHVPPDGQYRFSVPLADAGWYVYPKTGRWPMCGCCGEPMPCRAELEDRAAKAASAKLDELMSRMPGCCWACGEPITSRQQGVTYPGDNLDLPGGQQVRFHLRRACWSSAAAYEDRWLSEDPSRKRIITYPDCPGTLVVHADGSSECRSKTPCGGHLTHDHGHVAACFSADKNACPRGCSIVGHPGCQPSPRPLRRDQPSLSA